MSLYLKLVDGLLVIACLPWGELDLRPFNMDCQILLKPRLLSSTNLYSTSELILHWVVPVFRLSSGMIAYRVWSSQKHVHTYSGANLLVRFTFQNTVKAPIVIPQSVLATFVESAALYT